MQVAESEYTLPFFKEMGFVRRKCKVCGSYFWTLNESQEHCNDAPCVEYYFWDIPKKLKGLSVAEARRIFIEFFKSKKHEYIAPRPVVARWREDLYLTIASIVVFQPHVTRGIVPPPANPLVIVQPSIRLEDIDNVGLTFGRHLTSFEMGGHHAFNYPDKHVYWKDETIRYAFEFFTKILGIPEDMITFKESWWEGGGNAGPCFEVTVGGLELATLVFMQYDVVNGGYRELPLKIVDTGYGIERIAWFTQNVPTAFHAIYGRMLDKFFDELGVDEPNEKILWTGARLAGRMDPDDIGSVERFFKSLSERTGVDENKVKEEINRASMVYALLDHTKTIALMLGDGVVPSNTGEGYLARLVARRAYRILHKLGAKVSLAQLVEMQIDYWSRDYYPQLANMRDYILRVVALEEAKYKALLSSSARIVERIIKRKGKKLTLDDLIELYDSHGIPPDIVREEAAKRGISIEVPHDFYALVAKRHGASSVIVRRMEKPKLPRSIEEWASRLPETRRLFHENPYMREFKAKIIGVRGNYLVLDQTIFYPAGGGQEHDVGVIRACGEEYHVVGVEKTSNNVIVHILDKPVKPGCSIVSGEIDWHRRYKLMRHHTAVHILLGALRAILGEHVWQAGAEKTPEKARLDITHYELPSREDIRRIEQLANKIILEAIPVETRLVERNRAEEEYGFRIYQGGVPMTPVLRIVKIGDWDVEACFGTHVANTAEVGGIKIINVEKIQDGVVRFELVAGTQLAEYADSLEENLDRLASLMSTSRRELELRLTKLIEEYGSLRKSYSKLANLASKLISEKHLASPARRSSKLNIYLVTEELGDEDMYRSIMRRITSRDPRAIVIAVYEKNGKLVAEVSRHEENDQVDLRKLAMEARITIGAKGGGKKDHITLTLPGKTYIEKLLDIIERLYGG
ncbi:MAG: alanine--tRNA ligase [Pyrodictiaceae archaeon]